MRDETKTKEKRESVLTSPPGNLLRKPGLESLFECERKPAREKHPVVFISVRVCARVHICFCITACARHFLSFFFFFLSV